tara:strand:- start:658 stop:879 length:222 start_codon:yes stop_codon:yes gene_type:complete
MSLRQSLRDTDPNNLKSIKPLDSVGCGFNPITKMVYPAYEKGGYDLDNGNHLSDCTEEWFNGLSNEDFKRVNK